MATNNYDRDGDGLVDLEVSFADSGRGIDPETIRVTSDRALKGGPGVGDDILPLWRVEQQDAERVVLEEVPDHLLPRGPVRLTVKVSDEAGNSSASIVTVDLPPATLHKILDLRADIKIATNQIALGPEQRFAYVTTEEFGGSALSIVDLDSLKWVKTIRSPINALSQMTLDRGRRRLYLMSIDEPELAVFDLGTESFIGSIRTTARGIGVAYDAFRDWVYVGLEVRQQSSGIISVIEPGEMREVITVDLGIGSAGNPGSRLGMNRFVIDSHRDRLYTITSTSAQQGVLEIDLRRRELVRQFDLWPERTDLQGGGTDLKLDGDRLLASIPRSGRGSVAVIPIDGSDLTFIDVAPSQGRQLALSRDRREWALTNLTTSEAAIRLVNESREEVVWVDTFDTGEFQDMEFLPSGNAFVVAGTIDSRDPQPSPSQLLVYLYR